jgi:hypothetical protein
MAASPWLGPSCLRTATYQMTPLLSSERRSLNEATFALRIYAGVRVETATVEACAAACILKVCDR